MYYLIIGIQYLKNEVFTGALIYIAILALLMILKKRRAISWNCAFELIFCIYCITIIKETGIFTLHFDLNRAFSFNLVPFVDSSIIPVFLNFALFVPYGFLLPAVFPSCKGHWKKAVAVGAITSLIIELLQLFGGRYAEIDDLLLNTLGTFVGFSVYTYILEFRRNRKKTIISALSLCLALMLCFTGIYLAENNEHEPPDGLRAVEDNILETSVYYGGDKRECEVGSPIYNCFSIQLSNCGGHLLEAQNISGNEIGNDADCFIEITFVSPQNIVFENADDFSIDNADRILYNSDKNILYWGNTHYQYCLDYTKMKSEMQDHESEMLENYQYLRMLIFNYFEAAD